MRIPPMALLPTCVLSICVLAATAADGTAPAAAHVTGKDGAPLTLVGEQLTEGAPAPVATVRDAHLAPAVLGGAGGVRVVLTVPSLDTPVCSRETRTFNQRASALGDDVEVIAVSRDLPFAQARWCAAEGIARVRALSDYYDGSFGRAWGVLIAENGLLARAVMVLDREGVVRYRELVPRLGDEPDYDAALAAAARLVAQR